MRVGVVGAGIAGLASARILSRSGHDVVVFESGSEVGGRCTTHRLGPFLFDPGATSIAPRGKSLEPVMLGELDVSDLVRVQRPIYTHQALRVSQGDPDRMAIARFTYRTGNARLPQMLAAGLKVESEDRVEGLSRSNGVYRIRDREFDAVILAVPLPEAAGLLSGAGIQRPIGHVHYRSCLSVLLGYDKEMPEVSYHALIDPEQRHPLTWLSIESVKSPDRAPAGQTAMVAQLSPQYSAMHYEEGEEGILDDVVDYIVRLYGSAWASPVETYVKRWRYSQPESLAMFDSVNHENERLILASDGLIGGRVEYAYEAGARAAGLLAADSS